MRELIAAAASLRKDLVRALKVAGGLEQDPVLAMLGVEPGKPVGDPVAPMALGLIARSAPTNAFRALVPYPGAAGNLARAALSS
ncbi:MAG: hypothetical protein ACJ8H8_31270 [Geminicoccaceae bacterium]